MMGAPLGQVVASTLPLWHIDAASGGGVHPIKFNDNSGRCDIFEPSEAFRHKMDYLSHTRNARAMLEGLAALQPTTLACMQGSAWRGDGAALLRALADSVEHGGARQN